MVREIEQHKQHYVEINIQKHEPPTSIKQQILRFFFKKRKDIIFIPC
jgi:hypothetical protein